jgi:chemotaxis signal transduction protein
VKLPAKAAGASRRRGEPVILFAIGDYTFSIAAADVEEIREAHEMKPLSLPAAAAKVRHTFRKNGLDYFVVDSNYHYRLLPSRTGRLLVLRDLPVAITADSIDRMTEIGPLAALPKSFRGEERNWYKGLTVVDENVVPVVNPESFLSPAELEHLQRRTAARGAARL